MVSSIMRQDCLIKKRNPSLATLKNIFLDLWMLKNCQKYLEEEARKKIWKRRLKHLSLLERLWRPKASSVANLSRHRKKILKLPPNGLWRSPYKIQTLRNIVINHKISAWSKHFQIASVMCCLLAVFLSKLAHLQPVNKTETLTLCLRKWWGDMNNKFPMTNNNLLGVK